MSAIDRRHMARALDLARRGLYSTGPNPRVGCVIAHGENVVGEGWHRYAGEPHAEIHALAAAGGDSGGATAYVTLEPCRHTGRTGPCTRALIEAGIAKVVAAMPDPDPRVAGRGFAELAEAGIEVESGVMEAPARALNRGFVSRHERGRPWVRCKLAATLDGRTATATGESRWITGEAARADVHRLRAQADAVLTGIGTLLADDPRLDARMEDAWTEDARMEDARTEGIGADDARTEDTGCLAPPMQPPMRVIVDSRLRTPPLARALSAPGDVLIATIGGAGTTGGDTRMRALVEAGAEIVPLPDAGGRVSLPALMAALAGRGVNEVHTECGPTLAGALLESGLVDEIVVYLAPALLGDAARGMFTLPGVAAMRDRLRLEITGVTRLGADLRIDAAGPQASPDTVRVKRTANQDKGEPDYAQSSACAPGSMETRAQAQQKPVIPAKAGIQGPLIEVDSRFRGNDGLKETIC